MTQTDISTLEAVVSVYKNALDEIKRWTKIRDDLNKTLKEAIGEGVGLVNGVPAINVQRVTGTRFDSKLFVDEFPELAEKYMMPTETVRLTVVNEPSSN